MAANPSFHEHTEIAQAMKGVDFPAKRDAILKAAQGVVYDQNSRRAARPD
jgi:hypothetical protein